MFNPIKNWWLRRKIRQAGAKLCKKTFDEVCEIELEGEKPMTLLEIFKQVNDPEIRAKLQIQILLEKGKATESAVTVTLDREKQTIDEKKENCLPDGLKPC